MWAVQGILGALYERRWTGVDRLVECSLLETAIGFSSWTSAHGSPTTRSEPAKARAIATTHLTSA
jgi:crotonobetainyl-CoA:carnitine CoA-transferase CaiB-like acyl-CoA transferase